MVKGVRYLQSLLSGLTGIRDRLAGSSQGTRRRAAAYVLALTGTAVAVLLRWALPGVLAQTPYLAFYPVVVAAAAFGGLGPGVLAATASILCVDVLFTQPLGQLSPDPLEWARHGIFLLGGVGISILADMRRAARAREIRQTAQIVQLNQTLLQRATELESVRDRLATDLDIVSRLHEISTRFVQADDMRSLLEQIIRTAAAITGADKGHIQLRDEHGVLRFVAHPGFGQPFVDVFHEIHAHQAACGTAMARQQRVVVEDVTRSPLFLGTPHLDALLAEGVRAVQCTPLLSRSGLLLGVFSTHYSTPHRPTDQDLQLLDLLARQAADYIERMQAEQRLRHLNAHLEETVAQRTAVSEQRAEQLRQLAAELTQAEQRERRRVAQVLHDHLQQLLVGARLHVNMLRTEILCNAEGMHLCEHVDDLLNESLETSRSLTAELSPTVLYRETFAGALRWLAGWMRDKHGLTVQIEADETVDPQAEDIRVLLFQATRELLFNVVKHSGTNRAVVQLTTGADGGSQVLVSDEGHGFDPGRRRHAGEAGTGLGLSGIRRRVELLGGCLAVESISGKGTRVRIGFAPQPAFRDTLREATAPAAALVRQPVVLPADDRKVGTIRVLLADDHPVMRDGLDHLLQKQAGIQVIAHACDGQQAVDLALTFRPDVIVMDVSMPCLDGIEATRRILAENPAIRVIGLSMHEDADTVDRMRQAGAAAYLTKVSAPDSLVATIRERANMRASNDND